MSKIERTTFASGEVSARVAPRTDLARQNAAVARAENVVVLIEGGLSRAPGTRFIAELKDESEEGLGLEFEFSDDDVYSLVFNAGAMRVLRNGGTVLDGMGDPYEVAIPWAEADLGNLRPAQSGNLLFLACAGYQTRVLERLDHDDWTLSLYAPTFGPFDAQNLDPAETIQASGSGGTITLTASSARFTADDVGTQWRLDERDFSTIPQWTAGETGLVNGSARRYNGRVYSATVTGGTNGADAGPNPPTHTEGSVSAGTGHPTWIYAHSGYGIVRITAIVGAAPSTQATATVLSQIPYSATTGGTFRWWPPAWSPARGWPSEVKLHKDALGFWRDDFSWLSKPNDFYDLSVTSEDETALSFRLLAENGQRLTVRWALSRGLLVIGTASSEWTARGASAFAALTIDTLQLVPEDDEGSAPHRPVLVSGGGVFIGKNRKRLHFAKFDALAESVETRELTVAARHILTGLAQELAWQHDPNRLLYVRLADGTLAVLTFMPKEEILGWTRRTFRNGFVERVWKQGAADGSADDVYLIVRRTIDGATRRYIEKMEPFFEPADAAAPTAEGAFFVDCGLSYSGTPVGTLSGLDHLIGETVRIVVNGAERSMQTVSGTGTIAIDPLPPGATMRVVAGLPLAARVTSLPIEPGPDQSLKGLMRQGDAVLEVVESVGGTLAINGGPAEPLSPTGGAAYGAPLPLLTGKLFPVAEVPSAPELTLDILCDNALPFTLVGWVPDMRISEAME